MNVLVNPHTLHQKKMLQNYLAPIRRFVPHVNLFADAKRKYLRPFKLDSAC